MIVLLPCPSLVGRRTRVGSVWLGVRSMSDNARFAAATNECFWSCHGADHSRSIEDGQSIEHWIGASDG